MNLEEVMEELTKRVRKESKEIYVAECPLCGKEIQGFTEEQVITLAKTHIISKHKELMG
jgi:DNA repair exonuclease SbcCD ATPase subunit